MGKLLKKLIIEVRISDKETLILRQIQRLTMDEVNLEKLKFLLNLDNMYSLKNKVCWLMDLGLIKKDEGKDGRSRHFRLTERGEKLVNNRYKFWKGLGFDYDVMLNKLNNRALRFKNTKLEYDGKLGGEDES